jgi:hypothetical protein
MPFGGSMRGVADYAVAYDISDDGERERVEKRYGCGFRPLIFERPQGRRGGSDIAPEASQQESLS